MPLGKAIALSKSGLHLTVSDITSARILPRKSCAERSDYGIQEDYE
jgi:hypothetical protein